MHNTTFHKDEFVISPPEGSHETMSGLRAVKGKLENGSPVIISCFELTPDEIEKITRTRKVYLAALTDENHFVPVSLSVNKEDYGL